mmetsp:Transcript_50558/g.126744  ORF Transcript_50558/g.126744 Transcript_50558/m.126744 type:complete len:314 (+) Transcript_50558:456-1397(+)
MQCPAGRDIRCGKGWFDSRGVGQGRSERAAPRSGGPSGHLSRRTGPRLVVGGLAIQRPRETPVSLPRQQQRRGPADRLPLCPSGPPANAPPARPLPSHKLRSHASAAAAAAAAPLPGRPAGSPSRALPQSLRRQRHAPDHHDEPKRQCVDQPGPGGCSRRPEQHHGRRRGQLPVPRDGVARRGGHGAKGPGQQPGDPFVPAVPAGRVSVQGVQVPTQVRQLLWRTPAEELPPQPGPAVGPGRLPLAVDAVVRHAARHAERGVVAHQLGLAHSVDPGHDGPVPHGTAARQPPAAATHGRWSPAGTPAAVPPGPR